MTTHLTKLLLGLGLLTLVAAGQDKPKPVPFISAEDIAARIAKVDTAPLLVLDAYRASMQYLDKPMPQFAVHEVEDELFVVLDGSGTMNMGATLVNARRGNGATTMVADTATGGTDYKLKKGDMFLLPAMVARRVTQVDGKLVMMSLRVPK